MIESGGKVAVFELLVARFLTCNVKANFQSHYKKNHNSMSNDLRFMLKKYDSIILEKPTLLPILSCLIVQSL